VSEREEGGVAAFFDVDGTLLSVHSGHLYIAWLRRNRLIGLGDTARFLWGYFTYRLGFLDMQALADAASRFVGGRELSEVLEECRQWYESDVRQHLNPTVVALARAHRERGDTVVILTAGSRYLNDLVAADCGIEHVLATELELGPDERFTGRAVAPFCYGRGKIEKAETFAARFNVDLDRSWFYTDSISDLPMLERVGHARLVDPDPRLRIEAVRRGWPTVVDATIIEPVASTKHTQSL
jgi:HAD superfamily hydrolase (TIGR01490 family)